MSRTFSGIYQMQILMSGNILSFSVLLFRGKGIAFADPIIGANFKLNKQKKIYSLLN
jgi:hypothetical protein